MILLPAQFIPKQYLTGYGVPLVYAPNYDDIAEVGPCEPLKFSYDSFFMEDVIIPSLVQCATIHGYEWKHNPEYYK